ncbi:MAG: SDR family NAD(P)-dependent oxidoreductase [Acidimicrobiia bacterium]
MSERLEGSVVVVTGATGIARAAAIGFAAEGAEVFTVSLDAEECEALHREIERAGPGHHAFRPTDLRVEAEVVGAFDAALERFGRIDGLLAVAGGSGRRFGDGRVDEISLAAWQSTLDLNLTTTFLSVREAVRAMREASTGGSIAVVSSVLAEHPSPERFGTHAYAVAKAGQLALVKTAAATYAPEGIRLNAIAPAVVATPMSARAQTDEDVTSYVERKQPLSSGFLKPEAVVDAATYLLSSEAAAVTGQVIGVDGGWSVTEARL